MWSGATFPCLCMPVVARWAALGCDRWVVQRRWRCPTSGLWVSGVLYLGAAMSTAEDVETGCDTGIGVMHHDESSEEDDGLEGVRCMAAMEVLFIVKW